MTAKNDDLEYNSDKVRCRPLRRVFLQCKGFWMGVTVIPTFVVVLLVLVVFGLVMETRILGCLPRSSVLNAEDDFCTPKVLNASEIEYHSGHRYYSVLRDIGSVPLPALRGDNMALCDHETAIHAKYSYCLPISGRKDIPFCTAADRMDLLNHRLSDRICYASVLHMLLVEVYEELQETGNAPFLVFGSLLGAVRNGGMIPFTEDTDIGFVEKLHMKETLRESLRQKGYHMFFYDIWRVCVAPTHPLAGYLYDANLTLTEKYDVPYVDLYMMKQLNESHFGLQSFKGKGLLPSNRVRPFSQVTVNGMQYNTLHDPTYFLQEEYGPDYMTPKRRKAPSFFKRRHVLDRNN